MPLSQHGQQIAQLLAKPHTTELILALTDNFQTATQIYRKTNAPIQTAVNRLNDIIDLQIAIEEPQPPGIRRRQIKLNPQYTKLQTLLQKAKTMIENEIATTMK